MGEDKRFGEALLGMFEHERDPFIAVAADHNVLGINAAARSHYNVNALPKSNLPMKCYDIFSRSLKECAKRNCGMASSPCPLAQAKKLAHVIEGPRLHATHQARHALREEGVHTVFDEHGKVSSVVKRITLDRKDCLDLVTGCYDHVRGMTVLEKKLHSIREGDYPLLVGFFDADCLKFVNDIYDHTKGNAYLKGIVGIINGCLREEDTLFRYGGDEFVSISPGFGDVASLSRRLSDAFSHSTFFSLLPGLSASFGFKLIEKPGCHKATSQIIAEVSKAMEKQKREKGVVTYQRVHQYLLEQYKSSELDIEYFEIIENIINHIRVLREHPKKVLHKVMEFHKSGVCLTPADPLGMAKTLAGQISSHLSLIEADYGEVYAVINRLHHLSMQTTFGDYQGDACSRLSHYYRVIYDLMEHWRESGSMESAVRAMEHKRLEDGYAPGFVNIIIDSARRAGYVK
jgi:diguanylate cyclase (GGDEF)-like protein